jgi:hypothetical protein
VLEHLGWRLHRIWSTDWFNNPQAEAARLREVIASRMEELRSKESGFARTAASHPAEAVVGSQKAEVPPQEKHTPIQLPLEVVSTDPSPMAGPTKKLAVTVAIGDTVQVKYTSGSAARVRFTISDKQSDPSKGIVHHLSPMGKALLGAEEGDEIEVLVGAYVRSAIVEKIMPRTD